MPADDGPFEMFHGGPSGILVGVDDSTRSLRAGWSAAGLARRQGARLVAVFVAPLASLGAAGPTGAAVTVARDEAFRATAADMERRAKQIGAELGISITFVAAR